jgi:hypothetical protein
MMDINTTPLIDVMLVLLVMLIITIPIQLHSVNLNMPTGNPPPPPVLQSSPPADPGPASPAPTARHPSMGVYRRPRFVPAATLDA